MLLAARDAGSSTTKEVGAPVSYFYKDDNGTVLHDEVDFATACMNIGSNKAQSFTFKKAARAQLVVRASLLTGQEAGTI
ncbi:hypothetical protein BSPA111_37100 [Buttiauxella sp. A111]|nr:hypothetical protein BSPA111_37100 [Buttiauxella sp. A111]